MVTITARCHPALSDLLLPPVPARAALPDWLRAMPSEVNAASLGGESVRTVKHCPPFLEAMGTGLMIPLQTDLRVEDGEFSWDWDFPVIADAPLPRAPLGLHVPEQASGVPFAQPGQVAIKFINHWALAVPPGWRLVFTHPFNRADLPFQTLSGVVNGATFGLGYVHFPALWLDTGFTGTLPRGTPVAQVLAIPDEGVTLHTAAMTPDEIATASAIQEALHAERGVYRKRFQD